MKKIVMSSISLESPRQVLKTNVSILFHFLPFLLFSPLLLFIIPSVYANFKACYAYNDSFWHGLYKN